MWRVQAAIEQRALTQSRSNRASVIAEGEAAGERPIWPGTLLRASFRRKQFGLSGRVVGGVAGLKLVAPSPERTGCAFDCLLMFSYFTVRQFECGCGATLSPILPVVSRSAALKSRPF